ncbi:MAG: nucleoside hydrolase [Bryobacterales bacterium]|nr:nucleoside hydrolase [Bryobacteraceae bacterium]MDW8355828.1 nucleoside hydrolase [Bryobacterales bacterium]
MLVGTCAGVQRIWATLEDVRPWCLVLLCAGVAAAMAGPLPKPIPVIFDTDMGNDVDDALALAMLHAFESRGEVRLLAVTVTKDNPWAAVYVDLVNHFYGRGHIPVGLVRNGKTPEDSPMIRVPAERRRPDGPFLYPRKIRDGRQAPEATGLLRQVLAAQPEGSVVMIQVGFSTNLARLLESAPDAWSSFGGRELVARKVRLLSVMAGEFETGMAEFNVKTDVPSAQKVFAEWPTPVVVSGFEVGKRILYPARSIEEDFRYTQHHPIVDAYRHYGNMPYDRPTWDLTSVLWAVRPERGYFRLSEPGWVRVDDQGRTSFEPASEGRHRHLLVDELQRARILEAFLYLASQPPQGRAR